MLLFRNHLIALVLVLSSISCSKEAPVKVDEQELITTVKLKIIAPDNTTQTVTWKETSPSTPIQLSAGVKYEVTVSVLNESNPSKVVDITNEVKLEAEEHQFFYEFSGINVNFVSGDSDVIDKEGYPLFYHTVWTARSSGSGTVQLYLIHEPTSKNSTNRVGFGGATDIQIEFNVLVE